MPAFCRLYRKPSRTKLETVEYLKSMQHAKIDDLDNDSAAATQRSRGGAAGPSSSEFSRRSVSLLYCTLIFYTPLSLTLSCPEWNNLSKTSAQPTSPSLGSESPIIGTADFRAVSLAKTAEKFSSTFNCDMQDCRLQFQTLGRVQNIFNPVLFVLPGRRISTRQM